MMMNLKMIFLVRVFRFECFSHDGKCTQHCQQQQQTVRVHSEKWRKYIIKLNTEEFLKNLKFNLRFSHLSMSLFAISKCIGIFFLSSFLTTNQRKILKKILKSLRVQNKFRIDIISPWNASCWLLPMNSRTWKRFRICLTEISSRSRCCCKILLPSSSSSSIPFHSRFFNKYLQTAQQLHRNNSSHSSLPVLDRCWLRRRTRREKK